MDKMIETIVYFTAEEDRKLQILANDAGMTPGDYLAKLMREDIAQNNKEVGDIL